jgi:hypothetical protein
VIETCGALGQHAMDVLTRISAPASPLGEQWLREQEKKLR